mmetsp:Transcript_21720/g.68014  ORF Transcript_21720/g.68014 Transcript_21720/m.68014 type:complete len:222 (-) Transcript_21720:544-1209(-)
MLGGAERRALHPVVARRAQKVPSTVGAADRGHLSPRCQRSACHRCQLDCRSHHVQLLDVAHRRVARNGSLEHGEDLWRSPCRGLHQLRHPLGRRRQRQRGEVGDDSYAALTQGDPLRCLPLELRRGRLLLGCNKQRWRHRRHVQDLKSPRAQRQKQRVALHGAVAKLLVAATGQCKRRSERLSRRQQQREDCAWPSRVLHALRLAPANRGAASATPSAKTS